MPRRALRLTQDLPGLSIPLTTACALVEEADGSVTIIARLTGDVAKAARRRFHAAQALPVILPDPPRETAA